MRTRAPRSELYLRTDIANAVKAIDYANSELSAAVPIAQVAAYRAGFLAALHAISLAFDLDIPATSTSISTERQWILPQLLPGRVLD